VSKLFKIGGVQAIAAMAYGTQTIPKVDVIVGPGSPYVSAAQRIVKLDNLRMDFPAGPSEGMVLADDYASPKFVAADVLSEAEHGPDSAGILVTNSLRLAQAVKEEIEKLIEEIPQPRKSFIQENIKKGYSCIIVTRNIEEAIEFVNEYAVEHLVINTKNPMKIMNRIKHAGTFCIGAYSPITVGNFIAGANAILPTGGYAKMFSGVSVDSFVKKPTVEIISKTGLKKLKDDIIALSDFEGFPGHTRSITIRFEK
jgi:histidinol dehydrogenase